MNRAVKRSHSSIESDPFSVVTETRTKRRRPCTGGLTKNVKKNTAALGRRKVYPRSAQDPNTNQCQTSNRNGLTRYQCPICLESARNSEMKCLPCYQAFHETCIDEWLRQDRTCPVCRQETVPPQNAEQYTVLPQNATQGTAPLRSARLGTTPLRSARQARAALRNARQDRAPRNARQVAASPRNARQVAASPRNARPPLNNQIANTLTGHECPICLESTRNNETKCLPCYHAFHQACIDVWLREDGRCPVCRQEALPPQNASQSALDHRRLTILDVLLNAMNHILVNTNDRRTMLASLSPIFAYCSELFNRISDSE